MTEDERALKARIKALESDLADRNAELASFKSEVAQINGQLAELVNLFRRELGVARELQHLLLPTDFPQIPGFSFARKFEASLERGGDYFDVFDLHDRFRFGVLLSAASGHGMSALMMSVLMKFQGAQHARQARSPREFIEVLTNEITTKQQSGDTLSLFYAVVDRRSLEMSYASIGGCFAARIESIQKKVTTLVEPDGELGQRGSAVLEEKSLRLGPQDKVVFCTPGVFEVLNPNGERFGEERLLKILAARPDQGPLDLRNEILFQIKHFSSGRDLPRDVTILIMEVHDNVIRLANNPQ